MAFKRIFRVDDEFFARMDTEEAWWLLGLYMSDGCIDSRQNTVHLTLHRKDRATVETVAALLNCNAPIYDPPSLSVSILHFTSKRIKADLIALGCTQRKSLTLVPPRVPVRFQRHFWRGMVDGDGWIYFSRYVPAGRLVAREQWMLGLCGTHAVVSGFRAFVARHADSAAKIYEHVSRRHWKCELGGLNVVKRIARALYADATVFMPRKMALAKQVLAYRR